MVKVRDIQINYPTLLPAQYLLVFNPTTNEIQSFESTGSFFVRTESINGHLLIKDLGLILGTWFGSFRGMKRLWLRWMTLDGKVIWTPEEEGGQ